MTDRISSVRDALERIACRHVTINPLWWQIEARNAVALLSAEAAGELPCDVALPPRTILRKGVSVETLLIALKQREHYPDDARQFATFGFPPVSGRPKVDVRAFVASLSSVDEGAKLREDGFQVGDEVEKRSGYEFPGTIVARFRTSAGALRYVVEHDISRGMLHIFSGEQLSGPVAEEDCPGHVASARDRRVCRRCGVHIDSLRPPEDGGEPVF